MIDNKLTRQDQILYNIIRIKIGKSIDIMYKIINM